MKILKKTIASTIAAGIASAAMMGTAVADNSLYGDTRVNELPSKGSSRPRSGSVRGGPTPRTASRTATRAASRNAAAST